MDAIPFVSILMPVRNEGAFIAHSIEAVLSQDYPMDSMEIIVVDGMSTDGTRQVIEQYHLSNVYPTVKILYNINQIVPTGLNIAFSQASGDIIVRVDGHCVIASDYVHNCVQYLLDYNIDGIGGPIETIGETFLARAIAMAMSSYFGVGGSAFRTENDRTMLVDTLAFPAYKRQTIKKYGLFDEEFKCNEDDEYNYRLRKLGGKLMITPNIRSQYYCRTSLRSLWWQYFRYGFWKVRVLQKHPRQMRLRQFVPPAFVLALLASALLLLLTVLRLPSSVTPSPVLRPLSLVVVLTYLTANLAASLWTASKRGWHSLPLLPMIFVILHLSYGLGFLIGLVKFVNRWGDKQGKTPAFTSEQS